MTRFAGRLWLGVLASWVAAGSAAGATPGGDGLAAFVPRDALVFVERRGHAAVREAMGASNFSPIAADEAVAKFVCDSRVQIGKQWVKELFDLKNPADIAARQKQLHEVVEAFWQQPAAMCVMWGKNGSEPSAVFLCATGPYRASCRKGLEELMKIDVPPEGVAGTKQAVIYRKGEVLWKGLVKHGAPGVLPKTPDERAEALASGSVFLTCWVDDLLVIATSIPAADAMSGVLSVTAPGASLAGEKAYQAVAARTQIAEWAFRWHAAVQAAFAGPPSSGEEEDRPRRSVPSELKAIGLDRVAAVGGSEGYADKVVTRRMLVYAPGADVSMRLIRPSGSYERGVALAPRGSAASLAGEIDADVLAKLIAPSSPPPKVSAGEEAGTRPAGAAPASRPADPASAARARLIHASDGRAAIYLLDFNGFAGAGGASGFPVGLVIGVKDPAQARLAVEALIELDSTGKASVGDDEEDEGPGRPATRPASRPASAPAQQELYRGVAIRRVFQGELAILKDRVVVAFSRPALTAAIDAALDNSGGLPLDGKARALVDLDAPGALLARIDMAALAKAVWPLFRDGRRGSDFPLVSLPTTETLVGLLGEEVVLVQATADGILLKSRGRVPLLTKAPTIFPLGYLFLMSGMGNRMWGF